MAFPNTLPTPPPAGSPSGGFIDGNYDSDPYKLASEVATKVGVGSSADTTSLDYKARREFVQYNFGATQTSATLFIAEVGYVVSGVSAVWGTAGGSGAALQVEVLTGTTASGSGTVQLTGTIALTGTANTVNNGTMIATPTAIAAGNRVGIVLSGTLTGLANCSVTIYLTKTGGQ